MKEIVSPQEYKFIAKCQEMLSYIDFYVFLLNKVEDNYSHYIKTKDKKYLKQTEETEKFLREIAAKALKNV